MAASTRTLVDDYTKAVSDGDFVRLAELVHHRVVVEDDRAAVMYDLITDTTVGPVLCSEFLTIDAGRIRSSTLVFDWRRWPEVIEELRSRTTGPTD